MYGVASRCEAFAAEGHEVAELHVERWVQKEERDGGWRRGEHGERDGAVPGGGHALLLDLEVVGRSWDRNRAGLVRIRRAIVDVDMAGRNGDTVFVHHNLPGRTRNGRN